MTKKILDRRLFLNLDTLVPLNVLEMMAVFLNVFENLISTLLDQAFHPNSGRTDCGRFYNIMYTACGRRRQCLGCRETAVTELTFRQYPTIYTPITLYPTAPLYSIIIIYDTLLRQRQKINTKDIELNSVAISVLWHELPRLWRGQINVTGIRRL